MGQKILFVVRQAGSAAFCLPLWERWLSACPDVDWHIIADPQALNVMRNENLPIIQEWNQLPKTQYDVVISSATNDLFECKITSWARENSVRHIQFLDAPYNIQERLKRSNPNGILPEHLFVLNETVKCAAISCGLTSDAISIIGHPVWERVSKQEYPQRQDNVFVFASQPISIIPELDDLGYNEHSVWNSLCALQKQNPDKIKELVYCPHPSQKIIPDHFEIGTRLMRADENPIEIGGSMIGMFTALMVDAFLSGQRVVSYQPNLRQQDRCLLTNQGYIPLVLSHDPQDLLRAFDKVNGTGLTELKDQLHGSLNRLEVEILRSN